MSIDGAPRYSISPGTGFNPFPFPLAIILQVDGHGELGVLGEELLVDLLVELLEHLLRNHLLLKNIGYRYF
jgi:hypothetical protein